MSEHILTMGMVSSNKKTAEGEAFAGVVCTFKGDARISEPGGPKLVLKDGTAELVNPDFEATLSVGFRGSAMKGKFTLEGAKLPDTPKKFVGSPPFRLYPEGTFTALATSHPHTSDIKISFTIDLKKV